MNASLGSKKMITLSGLALLVLLAPLALQVSAASSTVTFGKIQNLSNDSGASTAPVVAAVGNHVYVGWEDTTATGKAQTYFAVSNSNGTAGSWTTKIFTGLKGGANAQLDAVQIAAEGNYVFMNWEQGGATVYACSSNNGASFTYGTISVPSSLATGKMNAQAVAGSGDYAYFTWAGTNSSGTIVILFSSSYKCGTPTTPIKISGSFSTHGEDEIAASGNNVYVVWDSIYFSASYNNGLTWTTPHQLRPNTCVSPCLAREPMISVSGNYVYITYPSDYLNGSNGGIGSYNTWIVVNSNQGNPSNWAQPKELSAGLSNTREVQVASHGSDVYVTSRGTKSGVKGVQQYVYVSTDNGNTFGAPTLVAGTAQPGSETDFGSVVVDQATGHVYVYWPHGSPLELYLGSSQDSGSTWATQPVSNSGTGVITLGDPGGSQGPMLATSGGHVYMVWEDTSTGSGDIYFVSS